MDEITSSSQYPEELRPPLNVRRPESAGCHWRSARKAVRLKGGAVCPFRGAWRIFRRSPLRHRALPMSCEGPAIRAEERRPYQGILRIQGRQLL